MKNAILGLLGALALLGCGGGGGGGKSSEKPRLAFLNASPDSGAVDFSQDFEIKASNVAFGTTTAFDTTKAQEYGVSVQAAGTDEELWSEFHTYAANSDTVVAAIGMKTPFEDDTQTPPVPELDKRIQLKFATIDRTPPVGNRSRLIIVHGFVRKQGFETPAIDFRNPGDTPLINSTNLAFAGIRALDVDSGSQVFQVRQNGTEQEFVSDTTFTLEAGKIYIALVSGIEGTTGATVPKISMIPVTTRNP